jgi:hypothetical protein
MGAGSHKPLKSIARLIVVVAGVLWFGYASERVVVSASLPFLRATLEAVQNDFDILSMDIARSGPNDTVRVRADYAHAVFISGKLIYPINLGVKPGESLYGWLQVNLTVGGLLQYGLLMMIVVLAWPLGSWREAAVRLALAIPILFVLLIGNAVSTILAELWSGPHQDFARDEFWPLLAWSKFLMGGGGAMLGLACAAAAIATARRLEASSQSIHVSGHRSVTVAR